MIIDLGSMPNIHQYNIYNHVQCSPEHTSIYNDVHQKTHNTQTQYGLIHSMLFKTYKSCVKICDISVSLSLFFFSVLGVTISQGVMLEPGSSSEGSTNHDSPTAGNVCVGPCRKDVES